ncbi:MAG TPA: glycosyltransferase family 2 protein [Candidatus Omnitrophica bacterium]|nr:glycosyltransferase family 2 protein [Candidatus Omnitrophota bacterium]
MDKLPVSVVILTKNEEENIANCINSVLGWADEIIVVDDESTDRTRDIAKDLGAKVFVRRMDIEGRQRNWAYQQAKNDWVLSLDADERVSKELKREIEKIVVKKNCEFTNFTVNLRNYIGNYWIRGGGWYPAPKVRLFLKDKCRYEEAEVHPRIISKGKCGRINADLLHYSYKGWEDFLNSLNKQTSLEALKWYKLSLKDPKKARYKMNVIHALWRMLDRFIRIFFAKKGYRDGFIGFIVAYFASLYQILSYAKYRNLTKSFENKM